MIARVMRITAAVGAVALIAPKTIEFSLFPMFKSAQALRPSVGFSRRACEITRWIPVLSPEGGAELRSTALAQGTNADASIVTIVLSVGAGVWVTFIAEEYAYRRYTTVVIPMMAVTMRVKCIMVAVSSCVHW
jgi:hypothetical protein